MKKTLFEKYKFINLLLVTIVIVVLLTIYYSINNGYCINNCSIEFKKGIINPVYVSSKWLLGILGVLLFLPSQMFRKWLLFIATPIILMTIFLVGNISVYSDNLLNPTRAEMAENGMIVLAVVTGIFVLMELIKRKK